MATAKSNGAMVAVLVPQAPKRSFVAEKAKTVLFHLDDAVVALQEARTRFPDGRTCLRFMYNEATMAQSLFTRLTRMLAPHSGVCHQSKFVSAFEDIVQVLGLTEALWRSLKFDVDRMLSGQGVPPLPQGYPGPGIDPQSTDPLRFFVQRLQYYMNRSVLDRQRVIYELRHVKFLDYVLVEALYESSANMTMVEFDDDRDPAFEPDVPESERRRLRKLDEDMTKKVIEATKNGSHAYTLVEVERLLWQGKFNPNYVETDGGVPVIFRARLCTDVRHLQVFAECGADLNAIRPTDGQTPLHALAADGDTASAIAMIDLGADVDTRDSRGQSPLHLACSECMTVLVFRLLSAGADPNALDDNGSTPLGRALLARPQARDSGRPILIQLLITYGAVMTSPTDRINALHKAVLGQRSDRKVRRALHRHDGNSPCTVYTTEGDPVSLTPLFMAVTVIGTDAIKILVERGSACLHQCLGQYREDLPPTRGGGTVLQLATRLGLPITALQLLDLGTNPRIGEVLGWTALHDIAREPDATGMPTGAMRRLAEILLERGADINAIVTPFPPPPPPPVPSLDGDGDAGSSNEGSSNEGSSNEGSSNEGSSSDSGEHSGEDVCKTSSKEAGKERNKEGNEEDSNAEAQADSSPEEDTKEDDNTSTSTPKTGSSSKDNGKNKASEVQAVLDMAKALNVTVFPSQAMKLDSISTRSEMLLRTPLHCAVASGSLEFVYFFARHPNVDLEIPLTNGWTAFIQASACRKPELVKCLRSVGANPFAVSRLDGYTALHAAVRANDMKTARYLVRVVGLDPADVGDGVRCLHVAAAAGLTRMVLWLLQKYGVDHREEADRMGGLRAVELARKGGFWETAETIEAFVERRGLGFGDVDEEYDMKEAAGEEDEE